MKPLPAVVATSLLLLSIIPARAEDSMMDSAMKKSPEQLMTGIENAHPATYYALALKLFAGEKKDDAVFWFYAGQLRYRFHLASHPELDPSGDPAVFASLAETVGRPINEYAFGDLRTLDATLGKVRGWDEKTPNGFTSKTRYAAAWKTTRDGMESLVKYMRENGEQIRAQRRASGLENRN